MINPSSTLIATLIALPAILAQGTNSTTNPASPAAPAGAANSSAPTAPASPPPTFAPTNFTPSLASSTTCGTSQQNFNQCIVKVGKDISSCIDNVCLCQTYANIATCYNACPELSSQGEAHQLQSSQYCSIAGVRPNTTTAPLTTPTNNTTSTPPTQSNTSPIRNGTSSTNTTSNANTFSAARGSGSSSLTVSIFGACAVIAAAISAVVM